MDRRCIFIIPGIFRKKIVLYQIQVNAFSLYYNAFETGDFMP